MPSLAQILRKGEYFGRILAIGLMPGGEKIFVLYGITGRSPLSRSRRLVRRPEGIFVEPLDEITPSPEQQDLLIYPAILFSRGLAASNGQHTQDIALRLAAAPSDPLTTLREALEGWDYEPDVPNYTPRISACVTPDRQAAMGLVRRAETGETLREFFPLSFTPGHGFLLATYAGENRNPLPSFSGPPRDFYLESPQAAGAADLVREFYEALGPAGGKEDLRVAAVALTFLHPGPKPDDEAIINRYSEQKESES